MTKEELLDMVKEHPLQKEVLKIKGWNRDKVVYLMEKYGYRTWKEVQYDAKYGKGSFKRKEEKERKKELAEYEKMRREAIQKRGEIVILEEIAEIYAYVEMSWNEAGKTFTSKDIFEFMKTHTRYKEKEVKK